MNGSTYISPVEPFLNLTDTGVILGLTSLVISLTVNTVVTGLIVLRILKVYWMARPTSEEQTLGVHGANGKLQSVIFLIIESGMAMFSVQLVRVVLMLLNLSIVINFVVGINQMLFVIIRSVIFFSIPLISFLRD